MGPTLVAYLRGVGAGATRTVEVTTNEAAADMVGALRLAATAAMGAAAAAVAAVGVATVAATGVTAAPTVIGVGSGLGLDPPGGGEEWRTRGLNLCPPRVFTMSGLEKGR